MANSTLEKAKKLKESFDASIPKASHKNKERRLKILLGPYYHKASKVNSRDDFVAKVKSPRYED